MERMDEEEPERPHRCYLTFDLSESSHETFSDLFERMRSYETITMSSHETITMSSHEMRSYETITSGGDEPSP